MNKILRMYTELPNIRLLVNIFINIFILLVCQLISNKFKLFR